MTVFVAPRSKMPNVEWEAKCLGHGLNSLHDASLAVSGAVSVLQISYEVSLWLVEMRDSCGSLSLEILAVAVAWLVGGILSKPLM